MYEHVKKTEKDGQLEVKTKTHAGGGNDRQDAYLYGHPTGRRKRFRSPADFFPHLLWLCTDESGDPDNCGCKICSPEDLDAIIPGAKSVKSEKPVKQESPAPQMATPSSSRPASQAPTTAPQSAVAMQQQQQQANQHQAQLMPSPLPPARSHDQQEDRRYNSFMYRPGEVVWFSRVQAWGLGVILRRWKTTHVNYTVQPLTYPGGPSISVTKTSEFDMRPWLAWSVPAFTHPGLNTVTEIPRFDTIDWNALRSGAYGKGGDLEVDGSILAAKSVDSTFTPFGQTQTVEPEPGVTDSYYEGIFIGGEKVWVGEPVRLAAVTGTDILVVRSIVGQRKTAAMTGQIIQQTTFLVGDMYSLVNIQHNDPNIPTPAAPNMNPHLPERLTQDLAYRNSHSIRVNRIASYWRLVQTQRRVELSSIKGRWYEASILLPILQDKKSFDNMVARGDIQEASLWMNSRGDCLNANRPANSPKIGSQNIRKPTRREALGRAIPATAEIVDSMQPPPVPQANVDPALSDAVNIDPSFDTAQSAGDNSDMDQFMNLDPHADMSGFAQQYGGQSQGFY